MYPYYQNAQPNYGYPYNALRQPTTASLNGRIVTTVEEAKASQIDLDGSIWYFPCPSEGKIYTKTINMQGLPVFNVYEISKANNYEQKQDFGSQILTLNKRIEELEKIVKEKHNEPTNADDAIITA